MKIEHVLFMLDGISDISRSAKMTVSKDRLKRHISPFLEVSFEKFFDSHL